MATPSETLSLSKVLSESKRIIKLHRHHFLALSLLFLFPPSLFSFLYPIILKNFVPNFQSEKSSTFQTHKLFQAFSSNTNGFRNSKQNPYLYLLITFISSLLLNLFSCFAVASISYSTYRISHDEPVDFKSSIKSIINSFRPLVSTFLTVNLFGILIITPFVALVFLFYTWLHHSSYFIPSLIVIGLILAVVFICIQVNWILAFVVVVVESKWGYEPLKRSAYLVKGNRGVALSMILYFGFVYGGFFWILYRDGDPSSGWCFVLLTLLGSFFLSQILLVNYVAAVVLYVYCRETGEGLPCQNPEKFPLLH